MGGDDCHTFTSARSAKAFGDYAFREQKDGQAAGSIWNGRFGRQEVAEGKRPWRL